MAEIWLEENQVHFIEHQDIDWPPLLPMPSVIYSSEGNILSSLDLTEDFKTKQEIAWKVSQPSTSSTNRKIRFFVCCHGYVHLEPISSWLMTRTEERVEEAGSHTVWEVRRYAIIHHNFVYYSLLGLRRCAIVCGKLPTYYSVEKQRRFFVDNLTFGVLAKILIRCSSHPQGESEVRCENAGYL